MIFKIDPKDPTRAEKYRAVLKSPTYEGLNKLDGFVELGTALSNSFHLSDFSPAKNPRPDHSWSVRTSFRVKDNSIDFKLRERLVAPDKVEIIGTLEPNDAKGASLGVFTSKWTQPIGKDCVILLSPDGQNFVAPQSDNTQLGYPVQAS